LDPGELAGLTEQQLTDYLAEIQRIGKKDFHQLLRDEAEGRPEHQGFIYVLSHSAMPDLLKIGTTEGPVQDRARQLYTTGVPGPFKVEFQIPVYESRRSAERKVHNALELYREHNSREFFRIPLEQARKIIEAVLR